MRTTRSFACLALVVAAGCGGRPSVWDAPTGGKVDAHGLTNAVALVDDGAHRALMLVPGPERALSTVSIPVGHHVVHTATSPDAARLFVLSAGDAPRRTPADEQPSLTILEGGGAPRASFRFDLPDVLTGLAIDPLGEWAAVFASGRAGEGFVENPNEIILVDLTAPPSATNPVARTLRSFGGRPERLTFTNVLHLAGGARRLLVVETDQDVSILDLSHVHDPVPRPEITVRLTSGTDTRKLVPAGVTVTDGEPDDPNDARIGIRTANDTNVVTLTLAPPNPSQSPPPPNDFAPIVNLTDVGGIPSDVAFVRTDGGLRLAAIVPSKSSAVLVEPETSMTTEVALPAAYQRLSLVTDVVPNAPSDTDVALLWSGAGSLGSVALWSLGKTAGTPYRSVEVLDLGAAIGGVLDVPAPNGALKILETNGASRLFVLDLASRTAAPLLTSQANVTVRLSPDGERAWAFGPGTTRLARLDLATLHPTSLLVERPVDAVFDVARDDGGRTAIAIHGGGAFGATVFDALAPDDATSRTYAALLMEGLR